MTGTLHQDLCELLTRRIGIRLKPHQQSGLVKRFMTGRLQALNLSSPAQYIRWLEKQPLEGEEFTRLIASVTNPHTFFFRDTEQFNGLRELIRGWAQQSGRHLHIWSAGCASGEEPFSLAMLCEDLDIEAQITATDISKDSLELARSARYGPWSLRHLPLGYRERFFTRAQGVYRVSPRITRRVTFRFHNLVNNAFPPPNDHGHHWDLILCRNVLIYFSRETVQHVINRFASVSAPGGWLFLSTTESLHGLKTPFSVAQVGDSFGYCNTPEKEPVMGFGDDLNEDVWQDNPTPTLITFLGDLTENGEPAHSVDVVEDPYLRVVTLIDVGDWGTARSRLETLLEDDPDRVTPRVTLGNLHLRSHNFEMAISAYKEAMDRAPLLPEIHYLLGVVYRKLGDLERAIQAFRHALFLQPNFWCASFLLAGVHGRQGRLEQRRLNLAHTLSVLEKNRTDPLFASHIQGMKDVDLDPNEVATLSRRFLRS
jgi:chemotaxis protein methyltransferase CheR